MVVKAAVKAAGTIGVYIAVGLHVILTWCGRFHPSVFTSTAGLHVMVAAWCGWSLMNGSPHNKGVGLHVILTWCGQFQPIGVYLDGRPPVSGWHE